MRSTPWQLRTVGVVGALVIAIAGCSSGGGTPSRHAISGTISGAVQAGVIVTLTGTATASTTTDASGHYQFADLADGSYTVTPSLDGYVFTPASSAVTLSGGDASGRDFAACTRTAADTTGLTLYDGLCGTTLDGSRWQVPGASARRVSGGAAWLRTMVANEEPRSLRNSVYNSFVTPLGTGRVTTLAADVTVPSATASRTGGADLRALVRLVYQPPANRLVFPGGYRDLLVFEVGLLDSGSGLQAYRQALHCDDASCVAISTSGIAFGDPADFAPLGAGFQAGTPAAYDTSYTVQASLDEATGAFHWMITGGAFGAGGRSGSADPTAYLGATASWAGVPLAGAGFLFAQMGTSSRDGSAAGGGSVDVTGRFQNVRLGLDDAPASLWDDFSGTGSNSGTGGFSMQKWSNGGNASSLPSSGGLVQSSALVFPSGGAAGAGYSTNVVNNLAVPAGIDVLQADVTLPSPVSGSAPQAFLQGRFYNDGEPGAAPYSALGDVSAMVRILPQTGTAGWFIHKCTTPTCTGAVMVVGTGTMPMSATFPNHTLRLGFDPTTGKFTFTVDGASVTVDPTTAGAGVTSPVPYVGTANAPFRTLGSSANVSATVPSSSMLVRFSNVYTGSVSR